MYTDHISTRITEKEYVEQRLYDQLVWYESEATRNQKRYKRLKTLEIALSVAIPVLSGIAAVSDYERIIILIIGILGGIVALCAGLLTLHKNQERWVEYRATAEELKREKFFYDTRMGPYSIDEVGSNTYPILVERVENILADERVEWREFMRRKIDSKRN